MSETAQTWYAIIDCAQDRRLIDLVETCATRLCLFKGAAMEVERAGPWLVRIDEKEPLLGTWQQHGAGQNWGLMVLSELSIDKLQRHFRRFLQAKLANGRMALFRFYDPRVFNTYIRAEAPAAREPWFAGVKRFAVERQDGAGVFEYWLSEGRLMDGGQVVG